MAEKLVSQLDENGYFSGPIAADESPLEPGVFLIPSGAVDLPPPTVPNGMCARYDGARFVFEPKKEPEPYVPTPEEIAAAVSAARQAAYSHEADPLFFKSQRGEATKDDWLAKVAEIKVRFPDGVMPF